MRKFTSAKSSVRNHDRNRKPTALAKNMNLFYFVEHNVPFTNVILVWQSKVDIQIQCMHTLTS